MAKFSFGSGEFGGGQSFGSGGSFSGKSGSGERRSPSIVAESLDEERLKPYLEGYQEYLSANPDDEEGAQLAGEDKLFTWENEHQSMLPLAGKVIQTGLKGVGINLPNIFEDYKGIPALQLGTGNTELNMDLESLSQEDQKKYIEGYTNYRNRHPDAKEDDLNAHLAGQSAVRSGWYENRWNKEPEGSKEQKLPEFWMPGGATRFEDLAPDLIEQLKNPQEQSKESPFQFGAEQTEVTDEKVRSTLEKIQGQLSELGGNGTVQETYAMQADANALSDYLNGITDDQDSVRPILDKWNIGNYQNALGQNQQQEEQQSAFTFSAEQTEVTDDAVRGTLSKIQERKAELGYNASEQQTYAMQADENALNDYLNGITDDPESVRPILEKWKAGNNLSELGKPEPNIWQKALTEKTMQDMRLALGLLTGEDNIDLSQMNTPALDALAGTASSAHEAIVNARNAFFASFQEGLLSAEESAAWLGFNLSNLLRLDGPVRAVNEWMISNALGHNVDLSGFNLLSEGFEGWAGAAQGKQQQLQADSDALKEAARPEMESVLRQFMSEQDAKTWTETILTDLAQGTGQTFGSMYPGMISMYTSAAGMLGGAGEAGSFIGRVWDALRQPGSWSVFINEAGQATKEARQRYGEGTTDWDLGMALVTGLVNTAIENYETKLGRGIQSIIEGGSFPGLASLITSGLTEMLEEGKQKFTGDLNQDIADVASGRNLTHKLSFTEEEALFNVADYLDLSASTYVTSIGLGVAMGGANLAAKPYRTAVENVLNGTATPEEARMAAEAAEVAMADQEAQRQAGTVETPTTEEQHKGFKAAADGENRGNNKAAGGTDARAQAAVEETGVDAWDEEQDYKREQFVLEELERSGAPQEQIDAQRAVVNEKLEAWNRAKAAPAEAREEAPAQPAPIVPGELEFERARQEFLEERDKMLELERREAPQEELDAQQAILDQKKAAMDQLNPFSYTPPAREESNLPPAETSYTQPAREESNLPPAETDVRTAEQRMREAQAAEVQAIIASNDPDVPAEEQARRAQEASEASARRAAAEEEYRRAQAAADAAVNNQVDQIDLRSQEEQRAQQAQDDVKKAEQRLKRLQEIRRQAEETAKQPGLSAKEKADAEKKAGIARRQEQRAQEAYNKALKAADEQNQRADARKASDDAAQNSIDQMVGILHEDDQTNMNAQDVAPDQNRQAAERLQLEEEARAAEQRMQEARAAEVQAIVATNNPDMPEEEREQREQEARDAIARREEAENEYREAQAAVDALGEFVPQEESEQPEQPESNFTPQERPEDQKSELVPQDEPAKPEQPVGNFVPQEKPEEQKSELVNQEPPEKPEDQVSNLVNQEPPAKPDDQVGTLVEDEAGEAGDGQGNAEAPKKEEPLSTMVEDEEEEAGEGEGSTGEEQPANAEENEAGENEGNTGETLSPEDQQLVDNANKHNDSLGFSHYDGNNWKPGVTIKTAPATLSQGQRSELSVFDSYAKKKGYTLVVHDQLFNEDGESVNGFYRPDEDSGRVIHVALDSENPLRSTMGHELYHMLKELNPEGAKRVAKEFARWANKAGIDINSLVRSKVELYYGQGYIKDKTDRRAWDYAYEEVVCDSLLDVIGDQQTVQALAIGDRNLVQRMRDWISKTMQQIHQMLSEYAQNSDEARILTEQEGALEKIREVFDKALDETNALQESKKAGKSLGSNSKMMDAYIKGLDAATTYSEANAEATKLAASVLKSQGLETSSKNINDVISMAQMMEAGYMLSEAAKELGIDIKSTPETERAVRALGRYVTSLLQQDKIEELEALYGVGTSSDEVISQEAEEEGQENTETKQKQNDDTKRSEPDQAIETVSKREGKNADMMGRVSDEAKDSKGGKLYSLKSMRNDIPEYRKMLKDSGVFSDQEINGLFDTITEAMKTIEKYASILDLNERGGKNDRAFSPVKPNSDALYKVSLDFSTLCRKRLLQQTIQEAIEKKYSVTMSKAERVALTNALKKVQAEGAKIEVACALCYVESARLKSPEQIRRFMADKRKYIIDYLSKNDKNYKDAIQQAADAKAKELGYEEGYSLKNMSKKDADAIRAVKRRMYAEYKPSAEQEAMIRKAETMDESMYKTAAGLAELKKNYPMVFDAYTTMVRNATKSKGLESDVPFYARDTFDTISDALIAAMNAENGLRSQSWSDFQVTHLLDYIGAIIELSTRGAKMQAYTKVAEYARLMGLTGQMINLSLIPTDYDGKHLRYDPKEGMDFETAQRLRNEFPDTVGSICIGIRDDHIRALLINDLIDYVIPYHKSSMDKATRNKIGLKNWSEYESQQNEKNRDYDTTVYDGYYHKHLNFSDWYNYQEAKALAENYKKQGMSAFEASKAAMEDMARKYVEICHSRGLQEKFANFSSDKGYWKLLIDRKMINQVAGELIEQKAVRPVFDNQVIQDILTSEVARVHETQPDMDRAVNEMLNMWENGDIQKAAKSKDVKTAVKAMEENFAKAYILESSSALDQVGGQGKASVKKNRDQEYQRAIDSGDVEKQQRMVDQAAKDAGYNVHAYHGTARGDRVGTVFMPERATSGPMAFFTDNREIAENYAKDKKDTSLAYDERYDSYEKQFRATKNGKDESLIDLWKKLPSSAKASIMKKAGHVTFDYDADDGSVIFDENNTDGLGNFTWAAREAKGNYIQALVEEWLNSGNLYNEEGKFLQVLEMAGVNEALRKAGYSAPVYFNPDETHEKVYDTYLKINHPFNTSENYNQGFIDGLKEWWQHQDQEKYNKENQGADFWDKNRWTFDGWVEKAQEDIERGQALAWTSIPDFVTDYLKDQGYDGIQDRGGKQGGDQHTVWIPFSGEQVKDSAPVTYDDAGKPIPLSERFNDQKPDIRWSAKKNQDKETGDKAADEKRLLEVETDIAGNDMQVWDLLKVMREMKRGQDAEGNAKGYWKKDIPKIVKTLEEEINSVGRTKEITKLVTEYFEDLDAFEGTTAAFMDYALQQGQALVTDLYRGEHRAYNQAMMQDYEGGKNAIRDFFRGGYWYISPAMKDYINTYIDSYRGFRRVMNAAGIRVTTVEGEKKSGHSVDLESAWKPRDPRTGRSDSNGLYEMLGGEETDSLGDIVQKVYDAITRESADEDVSLTMEEYDLTGKVGLTLVADYLQAGAMKEGARVSEEARGQKPPTEMDRLREETSAQRGVLQQKSDEIEQLNKEIDKLNNALSKEIGRSFKLAMQLKEMKRNGAAAEKLAQAKAELATANKEKQKAVNALEKAREKLDAQKDELNEMKKQLRKTERAYDNALSQMDDLKERRAEQMENMKNRLIEKYKKEAREKIAQAKARQKATKHRRQLVAGIRNTGAKLKNYMAHPNATNGYIPQQNAERAAELIEIMMANDGRKSAAKAGRRLMDSIRDAKESPDYFVSTMYDDELNRAMQEVARILEDKQSLYNLDDAELEIVHKTLKAINHQIQNADKTIGRQKNEQLASEAADGVLLMQRNRESMKGVGRMIRKGVLTHLNPQRFFAIWGHHGDNAITRMGEEASEGQRKKNKMTMDMTKVFEGLTQGENEKKFDKFTGKNATWYDTGIHILDERGNDTGRTWKITEAMRTFFALSWQADENKEGMRAGVKMNGHEMYQLTIPDEELMKKGKEKEAYARGERVYFTEADANAIIGELTDYEKQWMTAWRDMEKISKQAINETSLLLNGFRKANVGNYVPIFRDPRYIGKEFETVVTDSRLTSMGFLKERVNSHLPMMLMDLKNVINRQVRDVSDYYGFAIPARNLTKIYNANFGGTSFKEVLNKTQGMEVGAYFEKLMADLQGSSRVESSPLDKLRGNVAGAVLSGNPSVIIKQAASYPAAASVLGWKPLLKGLKYFNPAGLKGINVDKIDQYTSALWERRSRSLSDLEANANRNTRMSKTMHWLTNGIQGMDVATTKVIWKAAEYYVDEHSPNLSRGTDEYNRAVARIYEQALEGTQPEYGTMQRPGILRSQSQIVKSLTMYKTQSLQNFNILVDAATNLSDKAKAAKANNSEENQAALKAAKRQMATALSSQITSAVILGVMTAVGKALLHKLGGYRDDKGDMTAESVGGQILKDSASSVAGMVAGGSELFDLINGLIEGQSPFDIEAAGVSTINDLYQNTYAMLDAMKVIGDGDLTDAQKMSQMWPKLRKMGLSVAQLLGIPAGNFLNLIDGIAANAADFATGKPGSFASGSPLQIAGTPIIGSAQGRETSNKSVAGYIAQAMMDGDEAEAMRLYNEQIRQGKSVDALNSAIASWQKANIPEIRQAAEAIDNGDLSLYNQLINELTGKGLSMTNAVKYVEAERKKMTAEPKKEEEASGALTYQQILSGMTKETKTSEDNSYTNGMMNSLLEDGNVQAAMAVRDDMLANGKTKSSISSSLSSFWKPRLQEAYAAGDMVTVRQITQMLVQMGLKHTTIQGWTSSTGTSSSSSSSKKSSFGSGSFGGGSFGNSKKSSSKKSSFGSGSFGGKGFGK